MFRWFKSKESSKVNLKDVESLGQAGFFEGKSRGENPFVVDSPTYFAWLTGWYMAAIQYEQNKTDRLTIQIRDLNEGFNKAVNSLMIIKTILKEDITKPHDPDRISRAYEGVL